MTNTLNIKNKTGRKNNTKQIVTWPSKAFFTHKDDLVKLNSNMIDITLRTKVMEAIEQGKVKEIGFMQNGKGRPSNVYAMAPVTAETIELAKQKMIILHTEYKSMKVADINMASQTNSATSKVEVTSKVENTKTQAVSA